MPAIWWQVFFITVAPPESYTPPPAWADTTVFREIPSEVNCGDIKLPAMLSIPVNGGGFSSGCTGAWFGCPQYGPGYRTQ